VYALPEVVLAQFETQLATLTQSELFAQISSWLQQETFTHDEQSFVAATPPHVELGRSVTPSIEVHAVLATSSAGTIANEILESVFIAHPSRSRASSSPPLRTGP
jgi:hypothetical protein